MVLTNILLYLHNSAYFVIELYDTTIIYKVDIVSSYIAPAYVTDFCTIQLPYACAQNKSSVTNRLQAYYTIYYSSVMMHKFSFCASIHHDQTTCSNLALFTGHALVMAMSGWLHN